MKESFRKTHEYITNNWQNAVVDATDKNIEWNLPFPFVPPCVHGLFRCLYYWDTFFTNKGMLADGKIDLAKNNTGDLLYMLSQKDYVPNSWSESGTTYCSQPPYLHFMVRDVYEATGDKEWLKAAYFLLKREYNFWQTERMTALGLNRHFHLPLSKEKLIAYYDYVTRVRLHVTWEKSDEEKAQIAEQYVAVAESGQDWSPRFHDKCADMIPVDLNANLYGLEKDLSEWAELFEPEQAGVYEAAYKKRKELMDKYCLNADGTYHDYNYIENKQNDVAFSGQFMPFVTGMLSDKNAAKSLLKKLFAAHGITSTEKCETHGAIYQWAYPNSWAPDNYLAYEGLKKCGLESDAAKVAARYMDNVAKTYEGTGALWEKYDGVKGGAATQTEHEMTEMLGWTGGVFSYFYKSEYGDKQGKQQFSAKGIQMNGGYFDDNEKEYVITEMFPRRKWLNYLWNDTSVCGCDQFGFGTSWSVINGKRREIEGGTRNLTLHGGEKLVYIKDTETGEYYAANRNYGNLPFEKFECRVGLGYQKVISEYNGIRVEFTTLVPESGNVVQFSVKIADTDEKRRRLKVYFYAQPKTENGGHEADAQADYDKNIKGIYYDTTGYKLETEYIKTYFAADRAADSFAVTKNAFKGLYNDYAHPAGVESESLCGKGSTFEEDYAGAFEYSLELNGGEEAEIAFACGFAKTYEECVTAAKMFASAAEFARQLRLQKEKNEQGIGVFLADCPDKYVNSIANIWLKRQLSLGKDWGRLYGRGFRDVMQDTSAFVSLDPALARKRIPEILKHQYEDGNPIRMFEPDYTAPYNDSAAWIPATVLAYLYETGDVSVLEEKVPYLKGDSYENAYAPGGFLPYRGTEEEYIVFDHIKRAMDYLYTSRGKRGLVLFRHGDWNDSMNGVGLQGKGESVWLTLATIKAHNEFIEILEFCGKGEMAAEYAARRDELKAAVQEYGADGDHLLYGYNDYDEKIGADENEYAKIYLNPQTWAVLAGAFDKKTLKKYMDAVEKRLMCDFGYVQCAPSYKEGTEHIGRVSYFKEGLIENGSVYNHGVAFKIVADCLLGRGDNAYETLKKISYDNPKNVDNGAEPYAFSNMYIGPENKYLSGYAPMSWVTGTAGWLYRAITEYIFGVKAVKGGLEIKPCFPKTWKKAHITRVFRGATYEIEMNRGEENKIFVNGDPICGNVLPVAKCGEICRVKVLYR